MRHRCVPINPYTSHYLTQRFPVFEKHMKIVSAEQVNEVLSFPKLIDALQEAFSRQFTMPARMVFSLDDEQGNRNAFALLPSWTDSLIAVKAFTYFPDNPRPTYQSLYSKIMLFDRQHGEPLALVDGASVTYWRTAGVSGLASRLLSRKDSETLLLLGTGNLAHYLIMAHASVRPLKRILVWGRTPDNVNAVVERACASLNDVEVSPVDDLPTACGRADIIVSATGSHAPLIEGEWVSAGTHTDFLGNHHADGRECDTDLVLASKVYVDSRENCLREAGEILVPIDEGVYSKDKIVGELAEMCARKVPLRKNDREITLFKSVGTALSDLVAAGMAYKSI